MTVARHRGRRRPRRAPGPDRPHASRRRRGRRRGASLPASLTGWPPTGGAALRRLRRRCRARRTSSTRRTSTCAPAQLDGRAGRDAGAADRAGRRRPLPEDADGAARDREDGVAGVALSDRGAAPPASTLETLADLARAATRTRPRRCSTAARPARRRQVRPADPRRSGARASCSTSRPASASSGRSSSAGRSARRTARCSPGRSSSSARARTRRSSRSSCRRTAPDDAGGPGVLRRHARGHARRASASLAGRQPPGAARPTSSRSSIAHAMHRRGRRRSTGRSPSSAAGSSAAASTTGSRATAARSSRSRSCSAPTSSCST